MMVDPFNATAPVSVAQTFSPSMDNERAELVPDNEAAEITARAKAPLEAYKGTTVDAEA